MGLRFSGNTGVLRCGDVGEETGRKPITGNTGKNISFRVLAVGSALPSLATGLRAGRAGADSDEVYQPGNLAELGIRERRLVREITDCKNHRRFRRWQPQGND